MKRYLRITASVFLGLVTVALIVLWVRSYWYWDGWYYPFSKRGLVSVVSGSGSVNIRRTETFKPPLWTGYISQELGGEYWVSPGNPIRRRGVGGFDLYGYPWNLYAAYGAPYWFLVSLSATLTSIPWLRRPTRFSLRTILIAPAIVAIVLGLICYSIR